ncbi:MAG: c-type cytochrome [Planctomycetes bacterium]|nr:c-type cytochrome [Planctomycetota bacterium]
MNRRRSLLADLPATVRPESRSRRPAQPDRSWPTLGLRLAIGLMVLFADAPLRRDRHSPLHAAGEMRPTSDAAAPSRPPVPSTHPVLPAESLRYFQLDDDLEIQLVAHEPQVIDPVAIRFDERGRIWVVEMGDYPHGPPPGGTPSSRIRILEDLDRDGIYEASRLFADKLLFATGLQPWRDGAVVTLAGEVAFLRDTDGDGRADARETWYTGFVQENSQLRANHPRLGLDGWIYVANGLRGGTIIDPRQPDRAAVSISGRDFRFHPWSGAFEAVSGMGQFGLTFDEQGERFVCSNRNPLQHIVVEDHYLRRNPRAALPAVVQDVARSGEESRLFALTRAWTTSNLHAGQFTAACGVKIYTGNHLPAEYRGNAFTCDPTANLVHRERLTESGGTFVSRSPYESRDFLASSDEWFRPVNLEVGPEGALYLVDMYRAVIEHPQFMPTELQSRPDLLLGNDRGRIYRIVRKNVVAPPAAAVTDLPGALDDDNSWRRETAFRKLYERRDRADLEPLRLLASSARHAPARAAALLLLREFDALADDSIRSSLRDRSPMVRRWAIKLAESRMEKTPELREAAAALVNDDDPKVRFQAGLSLAPMTVLETDSLRQAALRGADDPWTRRVIILAAGSFAADVAQKLIDDPRWSSAPPPESIVELTRELLATSSHELPDETAAKTLLRLLEAPVHRTVFQLPCILAIAQGMARRGAAISALPSSDQSRQAWRRVMDEFARIATTRPDSEADSTISPNATRLSAIDLLAYDPQYTAALGRLATSEESVALRAKAIAAFSRHASLQEWQPLINRFAAESPGIRRAIVDQSLARNERAEAFLDAVASGAIKPAELDRAQADRFTKHGDPAIRQRAEQRFAGAVSPDREQVTRQYQPALQMPSDPARGREIFTRQCAACHRIGELGVNVAPDISDSRVKTSAQILTDILEPNRAIDNNYISYVVVTHDGQSLTGVLTTETASSITLKQAEGKTTVLLRSEIETLRSTGVSLMPEGLEKNIPIQDMADLVAFIKNWRYLDGRTPLGK